MKTGADISHWQASFDAGRYFASGEDFIILKATESTGYRDPTFRTRWQACAGKPRGAYHFAHPASPADAQADHFVATVKAAGWRGGDVFVLDLEGTAKSIALLEREMDALVTSPRQDVPWEAQLPDETFELLGPRGERVENWLVTWTDRWCARVRAALGGRGLFYSYLPFIRDTMGNPGRVPGGCLAWVARYRTDSPYASPYPRPAGFPDPPDCWQCSNGEAGCVTDVASVGRCDYNRMTDQAFAVLFSPEEGPFMALSDAEQGEVLRAARQINSAVGEGTLSFEQTVEAILAKINALVNEGRSQTSALGQQLTSVKDAVLGYLAAHPATASLSDEDKEALARRIAELDDDLEAAAVVDALATRLQPASIPG